MPPHHSMGGCLPSMMASEQPLMAPGGLPAQGPLPGGLPLLGSAGPPASVAPYRQLKVEDALAYLDQVKMKFEKQPHIYNQVRAIRRRGLPCWSRRPRRQLARRHSPCPAPLLPVAPPPAARRP
eukprot:scaffold323_cov94-Isochrysis_galbana.AAC.2